MKVIGILVVATIATVAADVSHLLAASLAAAPPSRYIPPIPNALRSAAPISNLISHGDIGTAAQTHTQAILPAPTPDSATQGPNPQDIATPEPEYIDIELPFPEPSPRKPAPKPAPKPVSKPVPPPAPRLPRPPPPRAPLPAPIPHAPAFSTAPNLGLPPVQQNYLPPIHEPAPAHTLEADGYHYRIPRRHY